MSCHATLQDDLLILGNERLERRYTVAGGRLRGARLRDLRGGSEWVGDGAEADFSLPGVTAEPSELSFSTREVAGDSVQPERFEAELTVRLGELWLRRVFVLYPDCPAIRCEFYLKGQAAGHWRGQAQGSAAGHGNIEAPGRLQLRDFLAPVTERLSLGQRHLHCTAVQFFDVTDWRNNLVRPQTCLPYGQAELLTGNLLLARDLLSGEGVFLVKEAPCSDVQLAWPGADFSINRQRLQVLGLGLDPADLADGQWHRGYAVTIGVASGGEAGLLLALREYQDRQRRLLPERDEMILVNTWGDRSQDKRIGESFALAELAACARLGVSHFQLDDGWQAGRTTNSATAGGKLDDLWSVPGFWEPHPERFPRGLEPVVTRARELGIQLALWFAPSPTHSYVTWEKDAECLVGLWRRHGIRTFKIDMVRLPDHTADQRFQALLARVQHESGGEVVFNLDSTASQRLGYHYGAHYGNLFLENRYTDWVNYHPHWTLRNLWQLSRYLPPQKLQIEFLNTWRNAAKYPAHDPLSPAQVGFEYAFAITLAAQPLAWFEATGLPAEAFDLAPTIRQYRELMAAFHARPILPIGEEPSGTGWTGFQGLGERDGWLLIYREHTQRASARLPIWGLHGRRLHCRAMLGAGTDFTATVDPEDGSLRCALPRPMSYALYRYTISA